MTTATITLAGVTKTVELELLSTNRAEVGGAVATIGRRGVARYPAELTLWRIRENAFAGTWSHRRTAQDRGQVVTDSDGAEWGVSTDTVVRNAPAQVVGWMEVVGATNDADQTRR